MFDAISKLFAPKAEPPQQIEPRLAVAALLVHLSAVDGKIDDGERKKMRTLLADHFGLTGAEVDDLIRLATEKDHEAVDYYRFTSALAHLPDPEKIEIVRMMWEMVYADDQSHEMEENMIWRVAELIHVPARDRNILRKQVRPD